MQTKTQALQDALELCVKEMCNYCRNEAIAQGLELTCVDGCETLKIAKAALAMPMRQCDTYDCKTDAETGFVEQTGETDYNPIYWQMFANWLFADMKEGDGDGK